jgi:hypothetical protein
MQYYELDWEQSWSPLYGSPIIIPENTMLWRGYDTNFNPIPERYLYYSSSSSAYEYAKKQNRDLGCFVTTNPIKLMDIRFMMNILERIIQTNQSDVYLNDFASSMISFGLCSLGHQITLLKERYKDEFKKQTVNSKEIKMNIQKMIDIHKPMNIIEQKGIRVAETMNDGFTMAFLQELFKDLFDGFVSPRLYTVFHTEKGGQLNPEMIIFNPKLSNLKQLKHYPSNVVIKTFNDFITNNHQLINVKTKKSGEEISMKMFLSGGEQPIINNSKHYLEDYEDRLNANDKETVKHHKNAIKAGKRWREKIMIINSRPQGPMKLNYFESPSLSYRDKQKKSKDIEPPVPCVPVSIFSITDYDIIRVPRDYELGV